MTPEQFFSASNLLSLVGWLLLLTIPRHRWATRITGTIIPLVFAGGYLVFLVLHWGEARGSFSSLQGVNDLFSNPWLLLAGWLHYLTFDLFVGTWETRDAAARGVPRWLVAPCLVLTLFFGPVGFLAYHAARQLFLSSAPGLARQRG